jgi:hypothetical protein
LKLAQALARREKKMEELKRLQLHAKEITSALERAESDLKYFDDRAERGEGQRCWLADILEHCEHAEAKKVFEGDVAQAFSAAVVKVREVKELQGAQMREVSAARRRAAVARETAAKELSSNEATLEETRAIVARIADEAQTIELNVDRYVSQAKHLQAAAQVEQEVLRLRSEARVSDEAFAQAKRVRDEARSQLDKYSTWAEDLDLFFKGHSARDASAILRGLQAVMPRDDPLPALIRTMLSERCIDVSSPTVISMSSMVQERLRAAKNHLHEQLHKSEATCQDTNIRLVEASKSLERREEQLVTLLTQVNCHLAATPLRNTARVEVSSAERGTTSGSRDSGVFAKTGQRPCVPKPLGGDALVPKEVQKHPRPSVVEVIRGTAPPRPSRLS